MKILERIPQSVLVGLLYLCLPRRLSGRIAWGLVDYVDGMLQLHDIVGASPLPPALGGRTSLARSFYASTTPNN